MSSSMLEQAVIDAQTLKEAAIKNAEQEVLERYSDEIKEAVDSLLEQEEDLMAPGMEAPGMEMGEETTEDPIVKDIPMKAISDQDIGGGLEEGEEIELNLDELRTAVDSTETSETEMMFEASESDLETLLEDGEIKNPGKYMGGEKQKAGVDDDGDGVPDGADEDPEDGSVQEEIELDEETLKSAIEEILKVDYQNVPRGMAGTTHPTKVEEEWASEATLAKEQDTEVKEENKEAEKAIKNLKKLEEQVKSLKSEKNRLVKEHNELKSVARQVSNKLTELNLANAKLVYQNRILESNSLNERQKNKLVEAVSNANSTEEAKVIYETLQDSLASKGDNSPKNLSEAISKNNRLVLKSNKKETQVSDSALERMKRLAGII